MHKVFISYHHARDQFYKDKLVAWNVAENLFIDKSVDTGDIDDSLTDEQIRVKIRDEYLRDSTVTILLVGKETKYRKHVDWELYSSMRDGAKNKKSGIIVIMLPDVSLDYFTAGHGDVEKEFYPADTFWTKIDDRSQYETRYPYAPDRILDCLANGDSHISVVQWGKIAQNHNFLRVLIDLSNHDRSICEYDLSRPMRRKNG